MSHQSTLPPPAQARLQLVVNTGQRSQVYPLFDDAVVNVGRDIENAIRIDDPSVSRRHLELHATDDGAVVVDLYSSNGTLLVKSLSEDDELGPSTAHRLPPNKPVPLRVGEALRVGPALIFLQVKTRTSQSQLRATLGGDPPVLIDPEMKHVYELVGRAAQSEVSVLIYGETGVGKEMLAETVHRRSRRAERPYLQINCAALPEHLLESELFGHEKGAFTGAHATKAGLLESTDGGTVFLDEIGELSLGIQAKLLRVLEERTLLRVGGTKLRHISVRFVTATNRDLPREVREGRFRSDLYYRISGLAVRIPPLRERRLEIEPLARYFLRHFCRELEQPEPALTQAALARLALHDWPGNVRELRNVIERAALMAGPESIRPEHVMLDPPAAVAGELEPDALTALMPRPEFGAAPEPAPSKRPAARRRSSPAPRGAAPSRSPSSKRGERGSPSSRQLQSAGPSLAAPGRPGPAGGPLDGQGGDSPPAEAGERARIIAALEACAGNQTRAAEMLGMSRRQLIGRIEFWHLPRPKKR